MRNRGRIMGGWGPTIVLITLLFLGCTQDCPVCNQPAKPYRGWLYASDYSTGWVYQIDTETDSLVDSVLYDPNDRHSVGRVYVSQEGRYLAVGWYDWETDTRGTRIYEAQTLQYLASVADHSSPVFVERQGILLDCGRYALTAFAVPGFNMLWEDSLQLGGSGAVLQGVLSEAENVVYLLVTTDPANDGAPKSLIAYDFRQRRVAKTWGLLGSGAADSAHVHSMSVSPDGKMFYFIGFVENYGSYGVFCHDLEEERYLFRFPMYTHFGELCASPDGRELYATDPGWFMDRVDPGTVFVLDAHTGAYLHGISLQGFDPSRPGTPLSCGPVAFTPSGEKAYVGSGRNDKIAGTIVVIDTKTREITKRVWPDLEHLILQFAIGPKR